MIEIEQQALFDYESLDADTRVFVQEKAQSIHARLKRTAEDVIAIGQDLISVKGKLDHGRFLPWLQVEFGMTHQTAKRFMDVSKRFGSQNQQFVDFPVSVLYELAAPSTPDTVIDMVESGQIAPTIPAIREAKREAIQEQSSQIPTPQFTEPAWEDKSQIESSPYTPPVIHVEPPPVRSSTLMALQSSETNEWYTPAQYVEAARELMGGIELDPASNELANKVIQATTYYDVDGLNRSWSGRVWLNPPYGMTDGKSNQEVWTHRLIERFHHEHVKEAVLLVNANTEAKWFQPLYNYLICLTDHRIRFYNASGESSQPTQGNALVYFGSQERRFIELFSCFGTVIRRITADEY